MPGGEAIVDVHRGWPTGRAGVYAGFDEIGHRPVTGVGLERHFEMISQEVSLRMLSSDHLAHDHSHAENIDLQDSAPIKKL